MANFKPKRPITQNAEYFYADTLENFLRRRPLRKGGKDGENQKLLEMQVGKVDRRGE